MEHRTKIDYVEFDKLHTKIFKDSMNDESRDRSQFEKDFENTLKV